MKRFSILFFIIFLTINVLAQDSTASKQYFAFPGYKKQHAFAAGISIARLPAKIVEEEINTLPMLNLEYRVGILRKVTLNAQLSTNYNNNLGGVGFQWTFLNRDFSMGIGENTSIWYGHMEQEGFRLKAGGILLRPYAIAGADFKDFIIVIALEGQFGYMVTYSDDVYVGRSRQPNSAYILKICVEQPLWNNHWVQLGAKLNYAKFFYQSWLAYSTLNEYLLYPEFSFSFIL